METKKVTQNDVYNLINNRVIAYLENGIIPWNQSWAQVGIPTNLITKKPYTGINTCLLTSLGYDQNFFLTFKQLKELGGSVIKGEKSCPVIFWEWSEIDNKDKPGTKKKVSVIKYYTVFNIHQCTDIPVEMIPLTKDFSSMVKPEKLWNNMPNRPTLQHVQDEAYYNPENDYINMPKKKDVTEEEYYYMLFQMLIHSTGHKSRLSRKEVFDPTLFGIQPFSQEDLVSEIGSSYLNSYCGIHDNRSDESDNLVDGWLEKLKENNRLIVFAASQAQRAVDYILNLTTDSLTKPKQKTSA